MYGKRGERASVGAAVVCRSRGAQQVMRILRTALLASVAALIAGAQPAWAGIYYEQENWVRASGGQPPRTTKSIGYISGDRARTEGRYGGSAGIFITHLKTGSFRLLVPDRKVYVVMPLPGPPPGEQSHADIAVTKTDQTKTISGFHCTRHDAVGENRTVRCWTTTDVELGEETATYWQAGSRLYPVALTRELAKVPGFPVRIEVFSPDLVTRITVTALKEQDVAESLFAVPADYKEAFVFSASPAAPSGEGPKE